RDELQLSADLGASGLRLRAGLDSKGEGFLPGGDRESRLYAGAGWSVGDRHRFSLEAGIEANSGENWALKAPTEASYRTAIGGFGLSLGFRQALGADETGT